MAAESTRYEGVTIQSYSSEADAEEAVRALRDSGFTADEISVVARDEESTEAVSGVSGDDVAAGTGIGAVTGGVAGALASIGVSEEEARHYHERYEAGEILVVITAGDREHEARRILGSGGTQDMPPV